MDSLELVSLTRLMERTNGRPEIIVGLIDGPVWLKDAALWSANVRHLGPRPGRCVRPDSAACRHGTLVASILAAKRDSPAPAICPACTLLVRPIFFEHSNEPEAPRATPEELADAIVEAVNAGARVLNLSIGLDAPSTRSQRLVSEALSYAAARDVIAVVAAGNQGVVGGSALTSHPWTIPVMACDRAGQPSSTSNLSASTGRWGLRAPGEQIPCIGSDSAISTVTGSSAAAPFVAGAAALLWSEFPRATAGAIKRALTGSRQRAWFVPPLLNAWAAFEALVAAA
jgi:subtilisin family serine protease